MMASPTALILIFVLNLYLFLGERTSLAAAYSPTSAAPESLITSPARIEERDVNSVCGFWTTSGETWSWFCNFGVPCMIDTYIAPNLVFCSDPGIVPYTTYYSYGSWPTSGCSSQEKCCPQTAPYPREHIFDSGATTWCQCEPYSDAISVTTQLGFYSVDLAFYTTSVAPSTSKTSSSVATTASTSGLASSTSSSATTTASSTSSPATTTTSSTNSSANTSSTDSGGGTGGNQPIGAIVGGVIGGVFVICITVATVIIILRRSKRNEANRVQPATVSYQDGSSLVYIKPELDTTTLQRDKILRNPTHTELQGLGVYEAPGD